MKKTFYVLILMLLVACTGSEIPEITLSDILEKNGAVDVSTLSREQRQSYKKLCLLLYSNLTYQDGKVHFTVSRKDLADIGFSEALYDKWNKEIADLNALLLRDTITKRILDEKFAKSMEEAREEVSKW